MHVKKDFKKIGKKSKTLKKFLKKFDKLINLPTTLFLQVSQGQGQNGLMVWKPPGSNLPQKKVKQVDLTDPTHFAISTWWRNVI